MAVITTMIQATALVRKGSAARHAAGRSVFLKISGPDTARWSFIYKVPGTRKTREFGLGSFRELSLAIARREADKARELLRAGRDPIDARRAGLPTPSVPTFMEVAEQHIEAMAPAWKHPKHEQQWRSTLASYAYPVIGAKPVDAITTDDILAIVGPVWNSKNETASRLRGRIEIVLDVAKTGGWRNGENPARWRGHLAILLPACSRVVRSEHYAAMQWQRVPEIMPVLAAQKTVAARALRFLVLTAARSGEVRGACWGEVNLDQAVWTIPAERMKGGREHCIPLSDAALDVLREATAGRTMLPESLIFPSPVHERTPLSDTSLTILLRRQAWTDNDGRTITAHGFRSSFRDWAGESTHHPREVIEHALAHGLPNKAEAAYARGTLLQKRAALMADWGAFCCPTHGGRAVPLSRSSPNDRGGPQKTSLRRRTAR